MTDGNDWEKVETKNPGPPSDHEHVWEPLPNWSGRYKCSVCRGLGYRAIVTADRTTDDPKTATTWVPRGYSTSQIVPYLCTKKGCCKAAVTYGRKGQRCQEHAK